jgi:hypothetical protein
MSRFFFNWLVRIQQMAELPTACKKLLTLRASGELNGGRNPILPSSPYRNELGINPNAIDKPAVGELHYRRFRVSS